ncbi:flagellar protein export ATPase FliI [Candidatus Caldatribacterium sp.]|uniref:flagellar protein export ATPase FliI n=1 Tax=Candidatus Caldatribacterium sp. TaxID=2282143 RepID=UPI00299BDFDF|nr:flagellar protein export ATPase FliI [Candidatus Caldatribacterium sp.]MDW8080993.1 flagellar protein export ATPase FliI [Candidatus Calescibacterium sp.]
MLDVAKIRQRLKEIETLRVNGKVVQSVGIVIEAQGPSCRVGDICAIRSREGEREVLAEVVGFRGERTLLMPLGDRNGIELGSEVIALGRRGGVKVGMGLLGRVLNALGEPIDGKGPFEVEGEYPLECDPPNPLSRRRIRDILPLGIRAIDAVLTCGKGQRVGIFAGSGVGKSTLLGMIARRAQSEVNVIALVGERGREVKEFIERDLQEEGLRRSCIVVATSDQAPLLRIKAAFCATAIAEYFRDKGKDVLFMMDSVTRLAMAQRELGLAVGEPPTTRGYTPSVFTMLPRLMERTGNFAQGTITALYTVLVEGDDMNDPVADTVRSILDGHIVLSRKLSFAGHYPAIDVLQSVSRLMPDITTHRHQAMAQKLREVLAVYQDAEDLINIGAYERGSNPRIDYALSMIDRVREFLRQGIEEPAPFEETMRRLEELFGEVVS